MNELTFYVTTRRAKFRVKISKNMSFRLAPDGTRQPVQLGTILTIGGHRAPDCLQINVPLAEETGHLMWLKSSVGCAIETDNPNAPTEIRGSLTEHMVHLGFTIAQHMSPLLTTLTLEDSALFHCRLPDNKEYAINMTDHDLAFYQKTYYEKRYNAVFASEQLQKEYEALLSNFSDASKKSASFDFIVPALNEALYDIYLKSSTWKDFFNTISDLYGNKKCQIIYPWIKSALSTIFENRSFSGQPQRIFLKNTPKIRYKAGEQAGGRQARQTRKHDKVIQTASPSELFAMNWKYILRNKS